MYYQPRRALGTLVGSGLASWAAAIAMLLLNSALTAAVGPGALFAYIGATVMGALAALFAFWTYALATLSYRVDRNGLVITWGPTRQVVPLAAIKQLIPGTALDTPRIHGISWWGYHVGRATVERTGEVLFYSTHQQQDQLLYVMTSERTYAIAVEQPAHFAREIQLRQDLGPTAEVTHHVKRSGLTSLPFLADTTARILALVAVLAGALVWALVAFRYQALPQTLELHFPPGEQLDLITIVGREAILELPRMASLILGINLLAGIALHAFERAAGYVLLIAATAVQLAFMIAIAIAIA